MLKKIREQLTYATARFLSGQSLIKGVRTCNNNKGHVRNQQQGSKGWATSFYLSLQPPENKNITSGGTRIKRKDNIQSLKEKAQMQFIHELLVHNYAACKAWHFSTSTLERKVVPVFYFHKWFLFKHREELPARKYCETMEWVTGNAMEMPTWSPRTIQGISLMPPGLKHRVGIYTWDFLVFLVTKYTNKSECNPYFMLPQANITRIHPLVAMRL